MTDNVNLILTPKQEKFCLEYFKSGNASAAYKKTYNSGRMTDGTIANAVNELLKNPKITLRLKELNNAIEKDAIADKQAVLEYWTSVLNDPEEVTREKLKASELLAKYHQMFIEKVESKQEINLQVQPDPKTQDLIEKIKSKLAKMRAETKTITH